MSTLLNRVRRVRAQRESGSSAAEYGLLVAAATAVGVTAVFAFGGVVSESLAHSCDQLDRKMNGKCETVMSVPDNEVPTQD